jgi:hypothetical protein
MGSAAQVDLFDQKLSDYVTGTITYAGLPLDPSSKKARWSAPILGDDPWGSVVERERIWEILGTGLMLTNAIKRQETGIDHRQLFQKYQSKREIHEIIRDAKTRAGK